MSECICWKCQKDRAIENPMNVFLPVMPLCSICGNKRCPKATAHEFECTGSNEPGQHGSIY